MSRVLRGICPHGVTRLAVVDEPQHIQSFAKEIGQALALGFSLERVDGPVTIGARCNECAEKEKGPQMSLQL